MHMVDRVIMIVTGDMCLGMMPSPDVASPDVAATDGQGQGEGVGAILPQWPQVEADAMQARLTDDIRVLG